MDYNKAIQRIAPEIMKEEIHKSAKIAARKMRAKIDRKMVEFCQTKEFSQHLEKQIIREMKDVIADNWLINNTPVLKLSRKFLSKKISKAFKNT